MHKKYLNLFISKSLILFHARLFKIIDKYLLMRKNNVRLQQDSSIIAQDIRINPKSFCFRLPKINYHLQVIKIGKNQLCYSKVSDQIKLCFLMCYKQCYEQGCLRELFKHWIKQHSLKISPRRVQIIDEDAAHLIWKMQTIIQIKYRQTDINNLKKQRQKLAQQINNIQASVCTLISNLTQIQSVKLPIKDRAGTIQQCNLIRDFRNQIKLKKGKIINLQRQLEQNNVKMATLENLQQKRKPNAIFKNNIHKTIKKIIRQLISQSIVCIFQTSDSPVDLIQTDGKIQMEQVYVVFQQSYNIKKIKKAAIIRELGSSAYLQKLKNSAGFLPISNLFLICHRCLNSFAYSQMYFCHQQIKSKQTSSYVTSNYDHYKQVKIDGDYFSDPLEGILPFFIYNKDSKGKLLCNRGFCSNCLRNYYFLKTEEFTCPYCQGLCNCRRCQIAISLVKLIAYDLSFSPSLKQPRYIKSLKLFTSQKIQDISEIFPLIYPQNNKIIYKESSKRLKKIVTQNIKQQKIIDQQQQNHKNTNFFENLRYKTINIQNIDQILYQNQLQQSQKNSFSFLEQSKKISPGTNRINPQFLIFPEASDQESI